MVRRRAAGKSSYNEPLTKDQIAQLWVLAEEGHSQRHIAKILGCAPSTVSKQLAADPVAIEALRARLREERASRWKQIESLGLDELIAWLGRVSNMRSAKMPARLSKRQETELHTTPRYITALRHTAETATRTVQLLTGGVTERIGKDQGQHEDEIATAEGLIAQAIEMDAIDLLPPPLRARARAEQTKRGSR